jgi:hypothetical protein
MSRLSPEAGSSRQNKLATSLKRIATVFGVPVGLVALSALYNLAAVAVLQHRYPPPGRIYKVNGYGMHLYCTGTGAPTVQVVIDVREHKTDPATGTTVLE